MEKDLEYQIEKDNSKKSIIIAFVGVIALLAYLFFGYGIQIISIVKNKSFTTGGLITGGIIWGIVLISLLIVLYVRFKKWKFPLEAKWNTNGIVIRYPSGKIKKFYLKDITRIEIEGESRLKQLIPAFYVWRFSWKFQWWLLYSGRTVLTSKFAFFHFKLKNHKKIFIPIPRDNINDAFEILKSLKLKLRIK